MSVDLKGYADKQLHDLPPGQYTLFDFERAFAGAHFDGLMFTWKGEVTNTLTTIKQQYINFFQPRGTHIMHMLTPSLAYAKSRAFKLDQWKLQYEAIRHLK